MNGSIEGLIVLKEASEVVMPDSELAIARFSPFT